MGAGRLADRCTDRSRLCLASDRARVLRRHPQRVTVSYEGLHGGLDSQGLQWMAMRAKGRTAKVESNQASASPRPSAPIAAVARSPEFPVNQRNAPVAQLDRVAASEATTPGDSTRRSVQVPAENLIAGARKA